MFRVRSAQRIKISDTDLIKRLAFIVLIFGTYLTVRMVLGPPTLVKGEASTQENNRAFVCLFVCLYVCVFLDMSPLILHL